MPALNHIHTYRRESARKPKIQVEKGKKRPTSYGGTYYCVHPDCSHSKPHTELEGKRAMCRCGEEFIIEGKFHFLRQEMRCFKCTSSNKGKAIATGEDLMDKLLQYQMPGESTILTDNSVLDEDGALDSVETILKVPENEEKQPELPLTEKSEELEFNDDDFDKGDAA